MKRCPPGTRRHKITGECVNAMQAAVSVERMVEDAKSAETYKDWYKSNLEAVDVLFGEDAPVFLRLLAATSQREKVERNAVRAIEAYRMLIAGKPFKGFMGAVRANLELVRAGYHPQGPKINPFSLALAGDLQAVPIDVHMNRYIYGWDKAPSSWSWFAIERVKEAAGALDWAPAETQAAIWSFQLISVGEQPVGYEEKLHERVDEIREVRAAIARLRREKAAGRLRWLDVGTAAMSAQFTAPATDELSAAVDGLLEDQERAFSLGLDVVKQMRREKLRSQAASAIGVGLATLIIILLSRKALS